MRRNYTKVTSKLTTQVMIRIMAMEKNKTLKKKVESLPLDIFMKSNHGT